MTIPAKEPGQTFRRDDAGYETARRACSFNAGLAARYPDLIVQANTAEEVSGAVKLARANGWRIGVRSGGHSWAGNHVRDGGILLDVSRLNQMTIDRGAMRAIAGPGTKGHELNAVLATHRLFFPVGHCEGVNIGGYLLQGGFGWNSRVLGLACQSVEAIDYVDAMGEIRHASANENADVYWAARGAGPGFFGVITRYHLKLYPRPPVIGAKIICYKAGHWEALTRWAYDIRRDVPESIEFMMLLSRKTPFVSGPGVFLIAPVFAKTYGQALRDLAFLRTRPRGASVALPFIPFPLGRMTRQTMEHYPAGHHYAVDNMWTSAAIDDLMPGLMRIKQTLPQAPSHMLWMNWAPPPVRPDMAYSLEDDIYIALYGVWKEPADRAHTEDWARSNMAAMAPYATGIQLADENLGRRPAPFLKPAHMARIDTLRAAHDPEGRFHPYMGRV